MTVALVAAAPGIVLGTWQAARSSLPSNGEKDEGMKGHARPHWRLEPGVKPVGVEGAGHGAPTASGPSGGFSASRSCARVGAITANRGIRPQMVRGPGVTAHTCTASRQSGERVGWQTLLSDSVSESGSRLGCGLLHVALGRTDHSRDAQK